MYIETCYLALPDGIGVVLETFFVTIINKIQFILFTFSNFLKSYWCKLEFSNAYKMMMKGRINYIIVILLSNPPRKQLPLEMRNYTSTYTYIDARKYTQNLPNIRKRMIRFAMPKFTLNEIKV